MTAGSLRLPAPAVAISFEPAWGRGAGEGHAFVLTADSQLLLVAMALPSPRGAMPAQHLLLPGESFGDVVVLQDCPELSGWVPFDCTSHRHLSRSVQTRS